MFKTFLARFKKDPLPQMLKDHALRDVLLSVERRRAPSEAQAILDANRIVNYAKSEDYAIFAEELWSTVSTYIKFLSKPEITSEEASFYRGSLSATMDALRISYQAFQFREAVKNNKPLLTKGESPTPGRN